MKFWLLPILLSVLGSIHAQNRDVPTSRIKGILEIEGYRQRLPNATITLLYAKDSVIVRSTFSDERGGFVLDKVSSGEYKLYIRYIGYEPAWRGVRIVDHDTMMDVGIIFMKSTGISLRTVEIMNEKLPMVIKKDTLEFNASAFKTSECAVVEELLKRLPGVEVGRDGTIKMNGVVVKKLLIDGKPFFDEDPTIATVNLTADMIDKIQFIDKKSDGSQFTSISAGEREKTINITIKKDARNSYSGRAGGTLTAGRRFAINGNINKFNDRQQIAFFINGSDINGYRDKGAQSNVVVGGHSNVRTWSGRSLYSKDLGQKFKVRGTYSVADQLVEDERNSERQNLLPDSIWYYTRRSYSREGSRDHILNADIEFKPDTSYILNLIAKFSYSAGNNFKENLYTSLDRKQQLINSGSIRNEGVNRAPNFSATGLLGKRFRKVGRTLSINMGLKYSSGGQQSINKSDNLFIATGGSALADTVDQESNSKGTARSTSLLLTYTEPLIKNCYLELVYGYLGDYGTSDRFTYDFNPSRKVYDVRNDSLSNSFLNKYSMHQASVKILAQKPNCEYSLGLNAQFVSLDNNNISEHVRLQQHAVNLFPSAWFNYSFGFGKHLQFSFFGDTQKPNTLQLQPVPDNSNPLYVQLGNPDLKPAFNGNFNVRYSDANATTLRIFSMGVNYDLLINKIVNASWFDSLGRQISQPLNVDGAFIINTLISFNFPMNKRKASIYTEISLGYMRDINYVNGVKGESRAFNITSNLNYHYSHEQLFDVGINVNANYNIMRYAMQTKSANFQNYAFSLDNSIHLPLNIDIGGSLICKLNIGQAPGYDGNVTMLNAFVAKALFKGRRGLLRLQGVDLLNSNVSFTRTVEASYIEDVQTTVAKRLFMISFTYFIRKGER